MKKTLVILITLLCICTAGLADEDLNADARALIPGDAEIAQDQILGPYRVMTLQLTSGEVLHLAMDAQTGVPLRLVTATPALPTGDDTSIMQPADALASAYPDACLLATRDGEGGQLILTFFTPTLCGEAVFLNGEMISRSLTCGEYMQNGMLTIEGALTILRLQRPNANVYALEQDFDDGILSYEGDALEGGMKYEFEINAMTGRLMEWERD